MIKNKEVQERIPYPEGMKEITIFSKALKNSYKKTFSNSVRRKNHENQ
jgi:hypothetical protein